MKYKLLLLVALTLSYLPISVSAHPVAYAGSDSIMMWNSSDMSDWMLSHTFSRNFSLSGRYQRIQTTDGERTFYIPHANFLLKRWNELNSQANIYFSIGEGGEKKHNKIDATTFSALEADWESRKFYISFREEVLISHQNNMPNIYMSRLRGGFAPYLSQFNELGTWFILQVEKQNRSLDEFALTPMVRLLYRNALLEFGVNQKGSAQFNFMIHY